MTVKDVMLKAIDDAGYDWIIKPDGNIECYTEKWGTMTLEFDEKGGLLKIY